MRGGLPNASNVGRLECLKADFAGIMLVGGGLNGPRSAIISGLPNADEAGGAYPMAAAAAA